MGGGEIGRRGCKAGRIRGGGGAAKRVERLSAALRWCVAAAGAEEWRGQALRRHTIISVRSSALGAEAIGLYLSRFMAVAPTWRFRVPLSMTLRASPALEATCSILFSTYTPRLRSSRTWRAGEVGSRRSWIFSSEQRRGGGGEEGSGGGVKVRWL